MPPGSMLSWCMVARRLWRFNRRFTIVFFCFNCLFEYHFFRGEFHRINWFFIALQYVFTLLAVRAFECCHIAFQLRMRVDDERYLFLQNNIALFFYGFKGVNPVNRRRKACRSTGCPHRWPVHCYNKGGPCPEYSYGAGRVYVDGALFPEQGAKRFPMA